MANFLRPWRSSSSGLMTRVPPTSRCSGSTRGSTLHPDGLLRSVYSGKTFSPEELIEADAAIERARTERIVQFRSSTPRTRPIWSA